MSNIEKSIMSHQDERKYDSIPYRLEFIKNLLEDNELQPAIDFDNLDTESFVHPNGYTSSNDSSGNKFEGSTRDSKSNESTHDIRSILNKKKYDFYKVINHIGGKLKYIKSGTTGHTFKGMIGCDDGASINYAVKVVAYSKKERYGDINDIRRPENAELMMIRLLSYFVVKKQTPHIILPIGTFYTSITPFLHLAKGNHVDKEKDKRYFEFIEKYEKGEYHENVSILISEWANRGDLLDFIKNNYREFTTLHWKVVFFQIISVLAVIQSKFPSFRHNDLKANNILIHKIEKKERTTLYTYTVSRKKYLVPNIGYLIKLCDFDFACIPGIVENAKVSADWTDTINVKPIQNRYYDLHYFFNTLIKKGFFPELLQDPSISIEIKNFVNRIVPSKYQSGELVTNKGRILVDDEYILPNNVLLNDPFFEDFRKPKKIKNDTVSTQETKKKYILSSE